MMLVMMMTTTDRTSHNNRPDIVILDKIVKEAYLLDVAIPNSRNLHSTITDRLGWRANRNLANENRLCKTISTVHSGVALFQTNYTKV